MRGLEPPRVRGAVARGPGKCREVSFYAVSASGGPLAPLSCVRLFRAVCTRCAPKRGALVERRYSARASLSATGLTSSGGSGACRGRQPRGRGTRLAKFDECEDPLRRETRADTCQHEPASVRRVWSCLPRERARLDCAVDDCRAQRDRIARTPTAPSLRRRAPCRVGHSPIFLCPRGRDRACHRAPGAPEPRARRRQSSRMGSFPTRLMADRHLQRVLVLSAARPRRTTQRRRSDHTSDSCDHNAAAQPLESTLLNLSIASTSDDVQF
jgi:hypothetical protein